MSEGFKFKPKQQNPSMDDVAEQLRKAQEAAKPPSEEITETVKPIEKRASTKPPEYVKPEQCVERIRIIFDDSGSMSGQKIIDAREGVVEFMRNCIPNQVAVAVHPMNEDVIKMDTNLPAISKQVQGIDATGGTPLFETWSAAERIEPRASRYVIFSDGAPNYSDKKDACIQYCINNEITCDTVLIETNPDPRSRQYMLLKEIADRTHGIFMVFDRNKMDFKSGFKYLAPINRLSLNAPGMIEALQEGRLK